MHFSDLLPVKHLIDKYRQKMDDFQGVSSGHTSRAINAKQSIIDRHRDNVQGIKQSQVSDNDKRSYLRDGIVRLKWGIAVWNNFKDGQRRYIGEFKVQICHTCKICTGHHYVENCTCISSPDNLDPDLCSLIVKLVETFQHCLQERKSNRKGLPPPYEDEVADQSEQSPPPYSASPQ